MMSLNNFFLVLLTFLISCNGAEQKNNFKVSGTIADIPDQKIFLEQIYFNNQAPEVLDTGFIKKGKFAMSAKSGEESLFKLRLEKNDSISYYFINDGSEINLKANPTKDGLVGHIFSGKSNTALLNLFKQLETRHNALNTLSIDVENLKKNGGSDSLIAAKEALLDQAFSSYKDFLLKCADTSASPIVALFSMMYTSDMTATQIESTMNNLEKRFPNHSGVLSVVTQFKSELEKQKKQSGAMPAVGQMAPDFTINDETGNPFTLSSLKGKYVLVDFWASWCGPCRRENPNVVKAYNQFKNKNFTILGVSLDESKDAWISAIKQDGLSWKQLSDLKYWNSEVVSLYKIDGIPFNVLIDPSGKIIATALREEQLLETLRKTLP